MDWLFECLTIALDEFSLHWIETEQIGTAHFFKLDHIPFDSQLCGESKVWESASVCKLLDHADEYEAKGCRWV